MSLFGNKKPSNIFELSDKVIEVNSIEEEYEFIHDHFSEAGAPLQIIKRNSKVDENKYAFDEFTLMCSDSGVYYKIIFKVKVR